MTISRNKHRFQGKVCHFRLQRLAHDVGTEDIATMFNVLFPNCSPRVYPFTPDNATGSKQTVVTFVLRDKRDTVEDALHLVQEARLNYGPLGSDRVSSMLVTEARGDGLTLVAQSHPDPAFDCFFIHGLQGHPLSTFTNGGQIPSYGPPVFWPSDWLPDFVAKERRFGRYFVFGYNSDLTRGEKFCLEIEQIARNLITAINSTRSPGTHRPIYLVGHSLGGLVACQTVFLAMSHRAEDAEPWTLHSPEGKLLVNGLVFFGTPFTGSLKASIVAPLLKIFSPCGLSSNHFVSLRKRDKKVKAMLLDMDQWRRYRFGAFPLLIFWEERKLLYKVLGGRFFFGNQIVKRESAEGYFDKLDPSIYRRGLDRDHRTIVKFGADEQPFVETEIFQPMFERLFSILESGPQSNIVELNTRPPLRPAQTIDSAIGQSFSGTRFQHADALAQMNRISIIGVQQTGRQNTNSTMDDSDLVMSAFQFRDNSHRFRRPDPAWPTTCEWIKTNDKFINWKDSPDDEILFITGSVGRGKSTLTGHIVKHLRDEIDRGNTGEHTILAPFYCRAASGSSLIEPSAILNHLLFWIGNQHPGGLKDAVRSFADTSGTRPKFDSIWDIFTIVRRKLNFKMFAIIDGIDEIIRDIAKLAPGQPDIVARFLNDLCREVKTQHGSSVCKILFVSQPLAVIDDIERQFPGVTLPINNDDVLRDVSTFVNDKLKIFFQGKPLSSSEVETLLESVKKASGSMFLFADRIIRKILAAPVTYDAFNFYEKLIEQYVPGDKEDATYLDRIYGDTLNDILKAHHSNPGTTDNIVFALKILCAAQIDLHPAELSHLVGFARVMSVYGYRSQISIADLREYQAKIPRVQDLVQDLHDRCSNLVSATEDLVGFNHSTARSFLLRIRDPDLKEVSMEDEETCSVFMSEVCMEFIGIWYFLWAKNLEQREDDPARRGHFLIARNFVRECWMQYLRDVKNIAPLWTRIYEVLDPESAIYDVLDLETEDLFEIRGRQTLPQILFLVQHNVVNVLKYVAISHDGRKVHGKGTVDRSLLDRIRAPRAKLPTLRLQASVKDGQGDNLLHYLASYGSIELMDYLLPILAKSRELADCLRRPNDQGQTPFLHAVKSDDLITIKNMIKFGHTQQSTESRWRMSLAQHAACGPSTWVMDWLFANNWQIDDSSGLYGFTPLMAATATGNSIMIEHLIRKGPDMFHLSAQTMRSVLDIAAEQGDASILRSLLQHYPAASPVPMDKWRQTPLFTAARLGKVEIYEMLSARFPDIQPDERGLLPVHVAAQNGNLAILQSPSSAPWLTATTNTQWTILNFAAQTNDVETVKFCLDHCHIDTLGTTFPSAHQASLPSPFSAPIVSAANRGHADVFRFLFGRQARLPTDLPNGETLLHLAARAGLTEACRLLIEQRRSDLAARTSENSLPIHYACQASSEDTFVALHEECLTCPAYSIDVTMNDGQTPLSLAIEASQPKIVKYILGNTAAVVDATNSLKTTNLMLAAGQSDRSIFDAVFERSQTQVGSANCLGQTAMHFAAFADNRHAAECLIGAAANPMAEDITKDTPMSMAIATGKQGMLYFLLRVGCNPFARNVGGLGCLERLGDRSVLYKLSEDLVRFAKRHAASPGANRALVENVICDFFANRNQMLQGGLGANRFADLIHECLRYLHDDRFDTEIARLEESWIRKMDSGYIRLGKACEGCEKKVVDLAPIYSCRDCYYGIYLCTPCYESYTNGKPFEFCSASHRFLTLCEEEWQTDTPYDHEDEEGRERLLERIRAKCRRTPAEEIDIPPIPDVTIKVSPKNTWTCVLRAARPAN